VYQKTKQNYFCHNFVKFPPGTNSDNFRQKMANSPKLCEVHPFATSPNSRQRTTVLKADVPNCANVPNFAWFFLDTV